MKKALTISIAQTLFTIEEDAYAKLDHYLTSIRSHFAHTEGHADILSDIEARISEKFTESKKRIITLEEVEAVIASMGRVEDFGDAEDAAHAHRSHEGNHANHDSNNAAQGDAAAGDFSTEKKKKLYRNPDDKILAGVASGLGIYFGVDALWMRLGFVLLTIFTNGFGILLYIVLALIMPEAKTSAQKLEMEGSPVTLETMSENIRDNFKKKVKPKMDELKVRHGNSITRLLALPFKILKKVFDILVRTVFPLIRILIGAFIAVISLGGILFFSFMAPLILTNSTAYFDFPLMTIVSGPLMYLAVIGIYLAIVIPLVIIFMLAIGLIRRKNILSLKVGLTLLAIWFVATICGGVAGFNGAQKVEAYADTNPLYDKTTRDFAIRSDLIKNLEVQSGIKLNLVQIAKDGDTAANSGGVGTSAGSTTEPRLQATGRTRIIDDLVVRQDGDTLHIELLSSARNNFCFFCNLDGIEATLYLPALDSITAKHGADISVDSWKSPAPFSITLENGGHGEIDDLIAPELRINVIHGSELELNADTSTSTIEIENGARLDMTGTSTAVSANVKHGSRVDFTDMLINSASAMAENGSRIIFGSLKDLNANAKHGSRIEYSGSPKVIEKTSNGSVVKNTSDDSDSDEIDY